MNGNLEIACQYDELGDFSYDEETYAMKDGAVFAVDIYGNERFQQSNDSFHIVHLYHNIPLVQ